MKPNETNKLAFIYHITCWAVLYVLWIAVFQNRTFALTRTLTVEFCYLIFIALDYYLIIGFLVPQVLQKKGYIYFSILTVLLLAVSALLRSRLALFMNYTIFLKGNPQPSLVQVFSKSIINIGVWVAVLTCCKILWDRIRSQKYIASIEHEKALTELSFLKAQINPHFLFNSLNSVYGNIDKTNKTARTILLKLSELLRYQLYECNVDKVPMTKEIEYIKNYVALQQLRKEEDLVIDLKIDPTLEQYDIAPLILVVFIENAFKHISNFEDRQNMIYIKLSSLHNSMEFEIRNTRDEEQQKNRLHTEHGIGIVNVKRRLELLYPDKYNLNINKQEDFYEVSLKLDLA